MAKLGLISDVHGDPTALELAWSHLVLMGADRIVCAGDVVGYGPFPDRVMKFLVEKKVASVRGNHDRWALERGRGEPDEFGGGTPSGATLESLATLGGDLVLAEGDRVGVVVHGSPRSDMEFITPGRHPGPVLDGFLDDLRADLLVFGHTHAPMWYRGERGLVVNPGSVVSMPVVTTSRTFALLDWATLSVTFHDVESGRPVDVPHWPG